MREEEKFLMKKIFDRKKNHRKKISNKKNIIWRIKIKYIEWIKKKGVKMKVTKQEKLKWDLQF